MFLEYSRGQVGVCVGYDKKMGIQVPSLMRK